jgi:hypothetical protein
MKKRPATLSAVDVFRVLQEAGAIMSTRVLAKVFDQSKPDVGIRARLFLGFTAPSFSAQQDGSFLLAECVFDGLSMDRYQGLVSATLRDAMDRLGSGLTACVIEVAELDIFRQLIELPQARLVCLEEGYLELAACSGADRAMLDRVAMVEPYVQGASLVTPRFAEGSRHRSHLSVRPLTGEQFAQALIDPGTPFTRDALVQLLYVPEQTMDLQASMPSP